MKKSAMTLLKDIQLNDQLGQTAGSSLVVKRDLHKREELRERIEYRSRRPAVFDEEDRWGHGPCSFSPPRSCLEGSL